METRPKADRNCCEKPDVLVLLTTQWRAQATGFAGDPNARTPCLDRLAGESLWLSQAATPHPFGVFARAAFLTGRRCPANGICDYFDPLPVNARTLAHVFSDAGYRTAFFGKWQLYERDPDSPVVGEDHARIIVPPDRRGGFDFWEGFESGFLLNNPLIHGTAIEAPTRFEGYQSDVLVDRFLAYQKDRSACGKPLFSVVSLDPPHPPYGDPSSGIVPCPADTIRLIDGTTTDPRARETAARELSGYYAHIEATDRAIGRLISELKSSGRWQNTLFAFTSAHGDMHGVEGKFRKGWPHEESVRIPMLLSWPAQLALGRDNKLLISLLDLGPTLLGLAANPDPVALARNGFHGQDLSGAIRGEGTGPRHQAISMPSSPPFAQQCPYTWSAHRDAEKTTVHPEGAAAFTILHANEKGYGPPNVSR